MAGMSSRTSSQQETDVNMSSDGVYLAVVSWHDGVDLDCMGLLSLSWHNPGMSLSQHDIGNTGDQRAVLSSSCHELDCIGLLSSR